MKASELRIKNKRGLNLIVSWFYYVNLHSVEALF